MGKKVSSLLLVVLNTLLLTLAVFHEQIQIPTVFQVAGRLHPMLLHLPIGFLVLILSIRLFNRQLGLESSSVLFKFAFPLAAFVTVLSAIAGSFLAAEESYSSDLINRHRNTGTILSLLTLALTYLNEEERSFKITGLLVIVFLFITGHYGSSVTHGENFILKPLQNGNEQKVMINDSTSIYEAALLPVLDKKCNSCHNPTRKKGNLEMTTWEGLLKGGENGAIWNLAEINESQILKRIHLPEDHDDHMPPKDKQQLTKNEKVLIELFIKAGAKRTITLGSKNSADSLKKIAWTIAGQSSSEEQKIIRLFSAVSSEKIKDLNTASRTITPISADDPALRVGFYLAGDFKPSYLDELNSISENITELYLSGMPIKNDDLSSLKTFKNLEILFLNNTSINDEALLHLQKLPSLRKISLSNTNVTSNGISSILKMPSLKEISAWNIKTKPTELEQLAKSSPSIKWILGDEPGNEILQLTPPSLVNESRILKAGEKIEFRHNLPGVTIRYSTGNEPEPDSVNGKIYSKPLSPDRYTKIRLKAYKSGWKLSNMVEANFFTSGIKPQSGKLLSAPAKDYRGNGIKTLLDAQPGDMDNHRDGQWLAFRENAMSALFEFEAGTEPGSLTVSYLKNTGSYILPPAKISVFGGNELDELTLLTVRKPTQPTGYDRNEVLGEDISIDKKFRYLKIIIEPVEKLPQWHGGKGQRAWIFSDEIFFYPRPTI